MAILSPPLTPPPKEALELTDPLAPKPFEPQTIPSDINIIDDYVSHTLRTQKPLPPIGWHNWWKELNWVSLPILTITPMIALWGAFNVKLRWETLVWSVIYYFITGLGM